MARPDPDAGGPFAEDLPSAGEEPDPRYLLANERTFLAWSRTALALVAAGVATAELLPSPGSRAVRALAGLALVFVGGFVAVAGYARSRATERALRSRAGVPASRLPATVAVALAVTAVLAALLIAFGSFRTR